MTIRRALLIICLLVVTFNTVNAAVHKPDTVKKVKPQVLYTDSSVVKVRTYSQQALNNYCKQPEFQYKQTTFHTSWWARFWKWLWSLLDVSKIPAGSQQLIWLIVRYTVMALGIGAIIFIILRLVGVDINSAFRRRSRSAGTLAYTESLENIHEINFDDELERAIARHDYRLAVRLLYLRCLKHLNDDGLINWQISKTNSDYINELKNEGERSNFGLLTRQFEFIWYGEFMIDQSMFDRISNLFRNFRKESSRV